MYPCLAPGLTSALGLLLLVVFGAANAQDPLQSQQHHHAAFASLVQAAQVQQRVVLPIQTPTSTVARRARFNRRQQGSPTGFESSAPEQSSTLDGSPSAVNSNITDTPNGSVTIVTQAPDSVCGFVSGSPESAITCDNGGICSWAPDAVPAIICADIPKGIDFSAKLRCLPRSMARDTSICDDVCRSNEFNLLCTLEAAPFCKTYQFPSSLQDYVCASTSNEQPISVDFTYSGQNYRTFSTVTWDDNVSSVEGEGEWSSAIEEAKITVTVFVPVTSAPVPDPVSNGGGGGGAPIGAIVGGTIGGVAVLGLIGLGIFFLRRRGPRGDGVQAGTMHEAKDDAATPAHPVEVGGMELNRMYELPPPPPASGEGQLNGPGTMSEVGVDNTGHHRGNLHEIG